MTQEVNGFDFDELRRQAALREAQEARECHECVECHKYRVPERWFPSGPICLQCWFEMTG